MNAASSPGPKLWRSAAAVHWWRLTAAHLVSAFLTAHATVLRQLAVESKENEIVAIPRLLRLLDLQGATVTIEAMGCQTVIAQPIVDQGGDYVPSVKENQPGLVRALRADLDDMLRTRFRGVPHDVFEEVGGDHGRIETRRVWTTPRIDRLGEERARWAGLRSVAVVESTREAPPKEVGSERRHYLSTLDGADAKRIAAAIRGHWGIENRLH